MLKLNDFINPELQDQGIALMRCLKNSIKRNIILPSLSLQKSEANSEYQTKLTSHNFEHKDLFLLFEHLYSKDEMSISDRNLIRRILLSIFPQALIYAGGKKLLSFTRYLNLEKGYKFHGEGMFYLVMRGTVKVNSPFYQKTFGPGSFFGHLQLLTEQQDKSLLAKVESDASLMSVTEQGFRESLSQYFQKLHERKLGCCPRIITDILEPIQIYLLCQEMTKKEYPIGNKINKKGDPITEILFIEEGKINEDLELQAFQRRYKAQNTIGLLQILIGSRNYLFDNFTLQQTQAFSIPIQKFKKIAERDLLNSLKKESRINSNFLDQSLNARSKTQSEQKENKIQVPSIESLKKFMRVRKVNLPYSKLKSPTSEGRQSTQVSNLEKSKNRFGLKYEASFMFIKATQTPDKSKQARLNRSFSLIREQAQPTEFKRYLDNIDVPSLAQFKSTESQLI